MQPVLSPEQYAIERAICDKAEATLRALWPQWAKGGAIPAVVTQHPDYLACNNDMRGRVEQFEILRDLPDVIFAYISLPGNSRDFATNCRGAQPHCVTVWTGLKIGHAYETGRWSIGGFLSSTMHQYRATIGGREYTGRGPGVGMYVRLRETAASKRKRAA